MAEVVKIIMLYFDGNLTAEEALNKIILHLHSIGELKG